MHAKWLTWSWLPQNMRKGRNRMELTLDTPATYRIRVKGHLDSGWSDRLGGLAITPVNWDEKPSVTTLYGQVVDQAALAGVLSALYNLHLPLLSVEYLGDGQGG
jgi:hypothetical protein